MKRIIFLTWAFIVILLLVSPITVAHGQNTTKPLTFRRLETGISFRFMPVGWFNINDAYNRDFRAYPALGFAPFFSYRLNKIFSVGVSPEITLNVIPNISSYYSGTLYAANLRIEGRYQNETWAEPFLMATGGYSYILLEDDVPQSARGFIFSGIGGVRLNITYRQKLLAEVGYQKGFQHNKLGGGDYSPSYLVTGIGWQMAF